MVVRSRVSSLIEFNCCSNNTIEVNLLECCEKEKFAFEAVQNNPTETDSPAGKVAAKLQDKTFKIF